jgi:diguanylate cyclase (GGDEF)-like protein
LATIMDKFPREVLDSPQSAQFGRRLSLLPVLALLGWVWIAPAARASCLDSLDPDIHQLQQMIVQDATKALNHAQALLTALQREPLSDATSNTARTAALYAVQAQAYGMLELDADARASAAKGLALVPSERDPVHVDLLLSFADSVYDSAGIAAAIQAIETARQLQPRGSPADTCLLLNRGLLEHRQNREDLAIVTLTQAYRASIAPRVTEPVTIALIDMDHFKAINDRWGHATGDHVLKEFALIGREALRESDTLGRWGGEEFLLVMPETPLEFALSSLERLRALVFAIRLPSSGSGLRVSLSAGLATSDADTRSLDELIARADAALYVAKNEGRDLVRVARDDYMITSTGSRRALRLSV